MAKITPRFVDRGAATGNFRHVDQVSTDIHCLSGHNDGSVSFSLSVFKGNDETMRESRVFITLDHKEATWIGQFSCNLVDGKPLQHAMTKRVVLINGKHRATVRGWWGPFGLSWHDDPDQKIECEDFGLSHQVDQTIRLMARLTMCHMQIDGPSGITLELLI